MVLHKKKCLTKREFTIWAFVIVKLKICKNCFSELEPIIKREYHSELDNNPYESFIDGYKCTSCDMKYNY